MKKEKPGYFVTYRHFRRNSGSATAACVVKPLGDGTFDIVAGFAFCNPDDQFSRPEGRKYARERLMKNPIIIKGVKGIAAALMVYLRTVTEGLCDDWDKKLGVDDYRHAGRDKYPGFDSWFMQFVKEL